VKLVVDAVAVRPGSAAVVIGGVIAGWTAAAPNDELVVLVDAHPDFPIPTTVAVESIIARPGASVAGRLWAQSVGVRRACRRHRADALLSAVTASAFLGGGCPRGAIVHDLRHELRPAQFSPLRRLSRRVLYGWTFQRADALFCNSARTRADLVARRPQLNGKAYVALLGADHAAGWRPPADCSRDYVLAFGHFANKNVDRVLRAWTLHAGGHDALTLRVCGLSDAARAGAARLVSELGIGERVELLPWLSNQQFESMFAGAAAVLFPSDFEGFGLPAVEAMLLGVPVVVSADPALLEVAGGHAVVAEDDSAHALAAALEAALALTPEELAAAAAHAKGFTWERCALAIRDVLAGPAGSAPQAGVLDVASAQ
jgi:glycosyltransferase involved in cell wall biosynthesis